ncbi:hypothetical protein GCM10023238_12370 [Streptomyces heliomycini]
MAWRDRLPAAAGPRGVARRVRRAGEGVDRGADGARPPPHLDGPGPAVPGDWDAAGRPPDRRAAALTVSRAPPWA